MLSFWRRSRLDKNINKPRSSFQVRSTEMSSFFFFQVSCHFHRFKCCTHHHTLLNRTCKHFPTSKPTKPLNTCAPAVFCCPCASRASLLKVTGAASLDIIIHRLRSASLRLINLYLKTGTRGEASGMSTSLCVFLTRLSFRFFKDCRARECWERGGGRDDTTFAEKETNRGMSRISDLLETECW